MNPHFYEAGDLENLDRIVLFGDSITEQSFIPELQGFGTRLANEYARRFDVINRGFSGYTTIQARILLHRIFPARKDQVKLVTFFFGANDAALPSSPQCVPIDMFRQNITVLLTSSQLKGKVLVMTPPPLEGYAHDAKFGSVRTAENTKCYRDTVLSVCKDLDIPCADVWLEVMKAIGWNEGITELPGSLKLPRDERLEACFLDGLHPSLLGYSHIWNALQRAITTFFPELDPLVVERPTLYWPYVVKPKAGTIIRWHLKTDWDIAKFQQLLLTVPQEEQNKINAFHFQKDRNLALGSQILQRHFIGSILGFTKAKIGTIARDSNNRPYFRVQATRPHDYNISHHATSVVLAGILESGRIGVDVTVAEPPREPTEQYLESFESCFSQQEWRVIGSSLARFSQHWALKESYVKATGTGIVVDLSSIEFRNLIYVDPDTPYSQNITLYLDGTISNDWTFELRYLAPSTFVAIAVEVVDESRPSPSDVEDEFENTEKEATSRIRHRIAQSPESGSISGHDLFEEIDTSIFLNTS